MDPVLGKYPLSPHWPPCMGDLRLWEVHFHWYCEAQYRSTLLSSCCIKFYNCMKSGAGAIKVLGKRSGKHNPNPQSWEQFVQLRLRSWANGQARQDPPLANYCFHSQSAFAAQLVSSTSIWQSIPASTSIWHTEHACSWEQKVMALEFCSHQRCH